jgi:hypothetical protein
MKRQGNYAFFLSRVTISALSLPVTSPKSLSKALLSWNCVFLLHIMTEWPRDIRDFMSHDHFYALMLDSWSVYIETDRDPDWLKKELYEWLAMKIMDSGSDNGQSATYLCSLNYTISKSSFSQWILGSSWSLLERELCKED